MEFSKITKEEFKNLEDTFPLSNFYQTTNWAEVKNTTGWETHFLGIKENDKIIALCLLLSKKTFLNQKLFYAPRGPLLDYTNTKLLSFFTENIKKYIKQNHGFALKIDPMISISTYDEHLVKTEIPNTINIYNSLKKLKYHHLGFTKGYGTDTQFRWSYCVDIKNKTIDDVMANLKTNTRGWIKRSTKYPLIVEEVNDSNIDDFKLVMNHTAIRQHHHDRSKHYYQTINNTFKERSKLLIVYLDRNKYLNECTEDKLYSKIKAQKKSLIPLASSVFILDKDRVNYVYGGAIKEYMSLSAQYKFQYEMLKFATENNYSIYDFGGISGNFEDSNDPHYGIYGFKKGFKGYIVEYIGEFDLIINNFSYKLYKITYSTYKTLHNLLGRIKHD